MGSGSDNQEELSGVSRRGVVKAGAAAALAATVWAEPTIKGLARRPAYAGAGSRENPRGCFPFGVEVDLRFDPTRTAEVFVDAATGVTLELTFVSEKKFQLSAVLDGCDCSIDVDGMVNTYISADGASDSPGVIQDVGGVQVMCFEWDSERNGRPQRIAIKEEICFKCEPSRR